jgi:hypothetical protein
MVITTLRSDSVSHTAIYLHVDDQALALSRLVNAEELTAQHRHSDTQYLTRANAATMHRCGVQKQFIKRVHSVFPQHSQ